MQTNLFKFLKYKPLRYALLSLFLFTITLIITGSDGWGPPAANESEIGSISRWCERVSGGFFREPSNTLGNLGFIIAGLYMFLSLARSSLDNKNESTLLFGSNAIAILYASASTFLGPGSMAMHGTHTGFGAWLDNVSMIAYILILWIYNLKRLFKLSSKIYFFAYTFLLSYFAVSYWFIGPGLGIGLDLFEVSIGLWIATEVLIKYPNIYGRFLSGLTVLGVQQIFGNSIFIEIQNLSENWHIILYFLPAVIPGIEKNVNITRSYTPWFWIGFISFFSALLIWGTGVPDHPWCNPVSWIQAHMIWHMLCAVATVAFFNFYKTERNL